MNLKLRMTGTIVAVICLGCTTHSPVAESIDGQFEPACMAFAGDTVEIDGENFTWRKFTDEIVVDDSGELVEPFPGFPKSGRFKRNGNHLQLLDLNGEPLADFYVRKRADGIYLLTAKELQSESKNPRFWRCALKLSSP